MIGRSWRPVLGPGLAVWGLASVSTVVLHLSTGDLAEYHRYASAALHLHAGRAVPAEYPFPALAVFVAPLLLPLPYALGFSLLAGAALAALLYAYTDVRTKELDADSARRLVVYLALGAVMFLTARYDLFAAAAAFLALRAGRGGRWGAAWAWSTAGLLLKLFPAVLWPAFLVAEWRATGRLAWRRLLWVAAAGALLVGIPALVAPGSVLAEFHYYLHRPPEVGSLASGLSLLVDWHSWQYVFSFHSLNVVSPVVAPLATAITAVAVWGCVVAWWLQWRGRLSLEAAALLTVTLVVLGMKVVSVQYLLWLVPFWALYRRQAAWMAACLLNTIVFPYTVSATRIGYLAAHGYVVSLTLAFFLRDVLIAVGMVLWLRSVATRPDVAVGDVLPPVAPARAEAQFGAVS